MNAKGSLALGVDEDVDAVEWVGVHGRHYETRIVGPNRNETKIKRATERANGSECWAVG